MKTNRNAYLQRTYGISEDEYNLMMAAQGYRCAICGRDLRSCRVEVDHDHKVAKTHGVRASVRGLLCGYKPRGCNWKLGRMDDARWLANASQYVSGPPARQVLDNQA